MEDRVDPWLLWPRAFCVGALGFVLGVIGHVSADGLLPGLPVLGLLLTFMVLLSGPMLSRQASRTRLVAMLVGGQTFVHLVITFAAGHRGDPAGSPSATPGLGSLPVVEGRRVGSLQDAYQGASGHPSTLAPTLPVGDLLNDMSAHAPMMLVHLGAAALVGLWLARGERCLWTVLALTGRRVLAAISLQFPPPVAPTGAAVDPTDSTPAVTVSRWQASPHSQRGPPLLAV